MPSQPDEKLGEHVFVSYQRSDEALAGDMARALQRSGYPVFVDSQISVGEDWDKAIETALRSSLAIVVLWTPSSVASRWVRSEARFALSAGRYCPAICYPCDVPVEFNGVEAANLVGWDFTGVSHPEWRLLVDSLARLRKAPIKPRPSAEAVLYMEIGLKYLHGREAPVSPALAVGWLEKALEAGHHQAADALAQARKAAAG